MHFVDDPQCRHFMFGVVNHVKDKVIQQQRYEAVEQHPGVVDLELRATTDTRNQATDHGGLGEGSNAQDKRACPQRPQEALKYVEPDIDTGRHMAVDIAGQ